MSPDRPAAAMSSPLAAADRFPRVRLGHAPTTLDPAPQLGAALGIELWIKRDDCTGLAFGGKCPTPTVTMAPLGSGSTCKSSTSYALPRRKPVRRLMPCRPLRMNTPMPETSLRNVSNTERQAYHERIR